MEWLDSVIVFVGSALTVAIAIGIYREQHSRNSSDIRTLYEKSDANSKEIWQVKTDVTRIEASLEVLADIKDNVKDIRTYLINDYANLRRELFSALDKLKEELYEHKRHQK